MYKIKTFEGFNLLNIFKKKKDLKEEASVCLSVAEYNKILDDAKKASTPFSEKMLERAIKEIVVAFENGDEKLLARLSKYFSFSKSKDNKCFIIETYQTIYDDQREAILFLRSKGFKIQLYEDGSLFISFKVPITEKNSKFESGSNFR